MHTYITRFLLVFACAAGLLSCKKGELLEGSFNGALEIELLDLPQTPAMEIYFNNQFIDSLQPGGFFGYDRAIILPSGREGTLSFREKGTDRVLLDTTISIPAEQRLGFRLAYSEELGIKTFLSPALISPDSVKIQFYNNLDEHIIPASAAVNASLYYEPEFGAAIYEPYGIELSPFPRGELNATVLTLPVRHSSGMRIQYQLRCMDAVSGNVYRDEYNQDAATLSYDYESGHYLIVFVEAGISRNKYRFNNRVVVL